MKKLALCLLVGVALPAFADRLPLPADAPASYSTECGSCHIPFPPSLLPAADWRRTLAGLDKHFGSDATVDAKKRQEIAAFLERHAGNPARLGDAATPPRITRTARFTRWHREVPARFWRDSRVGSPANCEACHANAAKGVFSEHDIAIPELRE